jgi:hypothetical protein
VNSLILSTETANLSIEHLLTQANDGGVAVRDVAGNVLAFVLSPTDREAWTYAEAHLDLTQNIEQVRKTIGRRGGITTAELLAKAVSAEKQASQ